MADGELTALADQVGLRSWFELGLQEVSDAAVAIQELDCVEQVRVTDSGQFEVVATDAFSAEMNVLAREKGWVITELKLVKPSLEDVFVALTGGVV